MEMGERATFGALLRRCRDRAELTQEELAERAGLSVDAIGLLERGERRRPQRHTLLRLAEALALDDEERAAFEAARHAAAWAGGALRPALPTLPTPFLGREEEVAAVGRLLGRRDVPLVTLTGPAGVGKTRLGLAVAARLAERLDDGALFVPLVSLRDPEVVASALMRALGIGERAGQAPWRG